MLAILLGGYFYVKVPPDRHSVVVKTFLTRRAALKYRRTQLGGDDLWPMPIRGKLTRYRPKDL